MWLGVPNTYHNQARKANNIGSSLLKNLQPQMLDSFTISGISITSSICQSEAYSEAILTRLMEQVDHGDVCLLASPC
jgi:hypothetical protein